MTEAVPIFIMGPHHSGTTILYRMMCLHPDVTWFSQFSGRDGSIPSRLRVPLMDRIEPLLRRRSHNWKKVTTQEDRWRRYVVPRPIEPHRIFDYLLPVDDGISPDLSSRRMHAIFDAECRRWGKPAIVIKLPRLFRKVDRIRHAYPVAPFVNIIRDGRAMALSVRTKYMRQGESPMQALEIGARAWLDAMAALRPDAAAGRSLDIRYEDFCTAVRDHIRRALEFSRLDPDRFPYTKIPETLAPTNDRWLKAASAEEMALLERLLGPRLAEWGYR